MGAAFANDLCSTIILSYSLKTGPQVAGSSSVVVCEQPGASGSGGDGGGSGGGGGGPLRDVLSGLKCGLPAPPAALPGGDSAAAGAAAAAAAASCGGMGTSGGMGASGGGAASAQQQQQQQAGGQPRDGECLLRLPFVLELETPQRGRQVRPHVSVKLLGPQSARLGDVVALTWQLTRMADAPGSFHAASESFQAASGAPLLPLQRQQQPQEQQKHKQGPGLGEQQHQAGGVGGVPLSSEDDDVLWYELHFATGGLAASSAAGTSAAAPTERVEESSGGTRGGGGASKRHGSVRLGRGVGSLATIEATVVPQALGLQDVPRLVLMGVPDSEQERVGEEAVFVYSA